MAGTNLSPSRMHLYVHHAVIYLHSQAFDISERNHMSTTSADAATGSHGITGKMFSPTVVDLANRGRISSHFCDHHQYTPELWQLAEEYPKVEHPLILQLLEDLGGDYLAVWHRLEVGAVTDGCEACWHKLHNFASLIQIGNPEHWQVF